MIFNLLKLRWPKKEIAKMKTETKSRKIKCRKKASTSSKRKVNHNGSDQHNVPKNNGEDENTEREEEGIMYQKCTFNSQSRTKSL